MTPYTYGETLKELLKFLNLKNKDEVRCIMRCLLNSVQHDPDDVEFLYSSNVVADNSEFLSETFKQDIITFVDGLSFNVDFRSPYVAADIVNKAVAVKTNHFVTNSILKSEATNIFNKNAKLVSISGVYFRSPWNIAFDENSIKSGKFSVDKHKAIQISYLYQKTTYKYKRSKKLNAQLLELPTTNNLYNIILVLPQKGSSLSSLATKLSADPNLFRDEVRCMKNKLVHLQLPKFGNISSIINARNILTKIGEVNSILNPDTSQIIDSCGQSLNRSISSIIHNVRLDMILDGDETASYDNLNCVMPERNQAYNCTDALPRAIRSITKYAFEMLQETSESSSNETIGAPICGWYLMAFLSQYSTGNTQRELLNFLDLKNLDEVSCISKHILSYFLNDPKGVYGLYSFNILADKKFHFPESFTQDLLSYVGGRTHNYKFSEPLKTATKINKVIADGTINFVQNTISPSLAPRIFNSHSKLAHVSGLFFMAALKKPWDRENITIGEFHVDPNRSVRVSFAYQRAIHKYKRSSILDAQLVQLDFTKNTYQVLIILPNKITGLKSIIQKVAVDPQILQDEISSLQEELVELYIPLIRNESSVVDGLRTFKTKYNLNSVFDLKTSQITDSCGNSLNQTITSITQKIRANYIIFQDRPYKESPGNIAKNVPVAVNVVHPSIYIIMKNSIPLLCSGGKFV